MEKAPKPNIWGVVLIIAVIAFLSWNKSSKKQYADVRLPTITVSPENH